MVPFGYNVALADGWEPNSTVSSNAVHKSGILYIARVELSPPGWIEKSQSDAHLGKGQHLTIGANYAAQNGIEYKGNDFEEDRTLTGFDISGHWNTITGQFEYNAWKEEYSDANKGDKEPKGWYTRPVTSWPDLI